MPDPIKDALRAVCETDGLFGIKPEADRDIMRDRAAAIAAFLRALPTAWVRDTYGSDEAVFVGFMREAVEHAARETT